MVERHLFVLDFDFKKPEPLSIGASIWNLIFWLKKAGFLTVF